MMSVSSIHPWRKVPARELNFDESCSYNVVVVSTFFDECELSGSVPVGRGELDGRISPTGRLIRKAARFLKTGGLLFVYGLPRHLPFHAVQLNKTMLDGDSFLFKYWIAVEVKSRESRLQPLPNSHIGLLMYLRTASQRLPTPFSLNTKTVRVPYKSCRSCGLNVRDWGGKKHLLNKNGAAISDIWDLTAESNDRCSDIPEACLERIYQLTKTEDDHRMLVVEQPPRGALIAKTRHNSGAEPIRPFFVDALLHADSLALMTQIARQYPEGVFDLAFADPPYNLFKEYGQYSDGQSEARYLSWCNEWLDLMRRVVRPGGSLLVLNIPKWAVYHAEFLNRQMEFRNWIVWDALPSPAGKLLPAHYALLCYTKPGGTARPGQSLVHEVDSREYCLRTSCVRTRKQHGDDRKEVLTDVWHDLHRIKHARDRDSHPCQLPTRLMQRIIEIFSDPGDWVFDPFGGAGTTAVAARLCDRHFVVSEIDERYVAASERNLERIKLTGSGRRYMDREAVSRPRRKVAKKTIESAYMAVCRRSERVLSKEELGEADADLLRIIDECYPNYAYLKKIARRSMEIEGIGQS